MKGIYQPHIGFTLIFFLIFSSFKVPEAISPVKSDSGNTITVIITNIRNKKGRIQLDLYKNQSEFEARKSDDKRRAYIDKSKISEGTTKYVYKNIPDGVYGLALLDDENNNNKIDYGWVLPKEGFGFGDYYHMKLSVPKFDNFKFYLKSDKTSTMIIRYM